MDRYTALEKLQAAARREMAAAALEQFAPFRAWAEELARAAIESSEEDFLRLLLSRDIEREPARLLREASAEPLTRALERAMAPALLSGLTARPMPPPRLRRPDGQSAIKASAGKGKPCGGSWIPAWKTCRLSASSVEEILDHIREGRPGNYIAEGKPLSNVAYGMAKKHAPGLSRTARPTAAADDIRHILKNHARELSAEDWASVLAGPQRGDVIRRSQTDGGNAAIDVWTPRGDRWLQKVYRVERNALAIHTMKRRKEK